MGLFDKAKKFLGGKGMAKVEITRVEQQPADDASFHVNDTVIKANALITGTEPCTILSIKWEIWLKLRKDGSVQPRIVATRRYPEGTEFDEPPPFPRDLTPGETLEQALIIVNLDLGKVLRENGYASADAAVGDPDVTLMVRCIADVKGSPFDPSAEDRVHLVAGTSD